MYEDLLTLIPHKPPFLFVDRVTAISENEISAEKKIHPEETFFKGHYPGNPIMPGVLICEAIFQSGAILVSRLIETQALSPSSDTVPVLTRIKETKFKKIVRPGDMLEILVQIIETLSGVYFMKGTAKVEGKVAVQVEFGVTLAKI